MREAAVLGERSAAAAKRTPSGIFARSESALADSGLAPASLGLPLLDDRRLRCLELVPGDRLDDFRTVEQALLLLGRQTVLDVAVLEDLFERATALVLTDHVPRDMLLSGASLEEKREEVLECGHEKRLYPGA